MSVWGSGASPRILSADLVGSGPEGFEGLLTLGEDGAEAVYYALNAPAGDSDRPWALFDAVKRLHDERPRQKN